jgi:hypothetical protein
MLRITYIGEDGHQQTGVGAVARALEHVHLGWALIAMAIRLPVLRTALQWINDAAGGGPREICEAPSSEAGPAR